MDGESTQLSDQNLRGLLEAFYSKHNPEKLSTLGTILERYKGKEDQLILQLKQKYGAAADPVLFSITTNNSSQDDIKNEESKVLASQLGQAPTMTPAITMNTTSTISAGANLAASFLTGVTGVGWITPNAPKKDPEIIPPSTSTIVTSPTNLPTSLATPSAGSDEAGWVTRMSVLQTEIHTREEEKIQLLSNLKQAQQQVASLQKEKQKQSSDFISLTQKSEALQRNLTAALDRESANTKDIQSLNQQFLISEEVRHDLSQQLASVTEQRDNKHEQLTSVIQINHRLSAQLRFLVARLVEYDPTFVNTATATASSAANMTSVASTESENASTDITQSAGIGANDTIIVTDSTTAEVDVQQPTETAAAATAQPGDAVVVGTSDGRPGSQIMTELEAQLMVSESSLQASRIELQISMREKYQAEAALVEQGLLVEGLQRKLSGILNELETASGSADTMRKQMAILSADLQTCRAQLSETESKLKEKIFQCETSSAELQAMRGSLQSANTVKRQVAQLSTEHARAAEAQALRLVAELSERLVMEREEYLSKLAVLALFEAEARDSEAEARQTELLKLREELFKSRRAEAQKDRELVFMQRQLCDAAGTIARLMETGTPSSEKNVQAILAAATRKITSK